MGYNSSKGPQQMGDIQFESDPDDVQIDFAADFIALKTGGGQTFIVSGTAGVDSNITGSAVRTVFNIGSNRGHAFRIATTADDHGDTILRVDTSEMDVYSSAPYKWRIGSRTVAPTHELSVIGDMSGSGILHIDGAATFASSLSVTGTISVSEVTASLGVSASYFMGDGSRLSGISAGGISFNGSTANGVITYGGPSTADVESNLTFDGTTLTTTALSSTGDTTLGDASGDTVTINAATVDIPNVAAGTDNTVVVYDGNTLLTDEIDSKVWGGALVDTDGNGSTNYITTFVDADTVGGSANLTFDGSALKVVGGISGSSTLDIAGVATLGGGTHMTGNVGINTSVPQYELEVYQPAAMAPEIGIHAITGQNGFLKFLTNGVEKSSIKQGSGGNLSISNLGTGGDIIVNCDGTTEVARFCNERILAKQTLSGSDTLQMVGAVTFGNTLAVSGTSTFAGTMGVTASHGVSASFFMGDGSRLTGIAGGAGGTPAGGSTEIQFNDGGSFGASPNLVYSNLGILQLVGNISASLGITGSGLLATGSIAQIAVGVKSPVDTNMLYVSTQDNDNRVAFFVTDTAENILFAVSGSGEVVVGGKGIPYIDGRFNVSGTTNEKLISVKSDSIDPVFYVSGSGNALISGQLSASHIQLNSLYPLIELTSSHAANVSALMGINSAGNVLIQNNTEDQHIVFKAMDGTAVKEGLRLDGAVPEVVVNQTADSLLNFRVESQNNEYMFYVKGDSDTIGINNPSPKTALDVHHNPTSLANDTGGGDVVTFGAGTTVAGVTYYLHSSSNWYETSTQVAASGGLGLLATALGTSPSTDGMLLRGFFDYNTALKGTFSPGATVYLSSSGGGLTVNAPSGSGQNLRVVGHCTTTANVIYFNPSRDYMTIV